MSKNRFFFKTLFLKTCTFNTNKMRHAIILRKDNIACNQTDKIQFNFLLVMLERLSTIYSFTARF